MVSRQDPFPTPPHLRGREQPTLKREHRGLHAIVAVLLAVLGWAGLDRWIETSTLPDLHPEVSATVVDRDGRLLRAYQVSDGRWRLPISQRDVDRGYLAQLLAYEDKRFWHHPGVDLLSMGRALGQALRHGRAVSGASTLTMQVARLLEEAPTRSWRAKLRQIRVALALERRLSKGEILDLYLTLAPFGGNLEGVRAGSLAWFGKEPARLTPAEAALLVALPQSPEVRRPDRHPARARAARDRVLARVAGTGALATGDAAAARREPVPSRRLPFPRLSPLLADRLVADAGAEPVETTLDRTLQRDLEALIAERATGFPAAVSAAIMVADHETGEILASIGSTALTDTTRSGFIDMTRAVRSPGSTLKPLIYGLGFETGVAHPESLIEDRATNFGGYVPTNFDDAYHGTVSVRTALQRSLNVPAVAVLDAVGPARLMARMRRAGADPRLPPGRQPGLAIGLGGIGLRLTDLMAIYAAVARGGEAAPLHVTPSEHGKMRRVLSATAAWHVSDVLAAAPAPVAASNGQLAFKTGTSYGHRDAWAIGYDGAHVVGVWIGRPDAAPVPGMTGIRDAAPLLFEAFARLKPAPEPLRPPPPETLIVTHAELPAPLRRVAGPRGKLDENGPEIAYPPSGARVSLGGRPLVLKVRDGALPLTWLIDGEPVEVMGFERETAWRPDGPGFVDISVIDANGDGARARIYLDD